MRGTFTIYKKELKSYLYSPIAYVLVGVFLLLSGFFFYNLMWWFNSQSLTMARNPYYAKQLNINRFVFEPFFHNASIVLLLILPLLTMKLFSEERKSGTEELLFTSPVGNGEIVYGKFLASTTVLLIMLAGMGILSIFPFLYSKPEVYPVVVGFLGIFLMGIAFISVGVFTSSLTENQVVSASLGFGVLLLLWVLSWIAEASGEPIREILRYVSFFEHFKEMPKGVLNITDVVYYLSFTYFMLFLTTSYLEARRWR